jgi:hypothetical protein
VCDSSILIWPARLFFDLWDTLPDNVIEVYHCIRVISHTTKGLKMGESLMYSRIALPNLVATNPMWLLKFEIK